MDSNITMSQKEVKKYDIIKKVIDKLLSGSEAAKLLNLSTRHIRRLKKRVIEKGIKGLIHGSRGKQGNRSIPEKEKKEIIELLHEHWGCRRMRFC